jgi:hypothetical protein
VGIYINGTSISHARAHVYAHLSHQEEELLPGPTTSGVQGLLLFGVAVSELEIYARQQWSLPTFETEHRSNIV